MNEALQLLQHLFNLPGKHHVEVAKFGQPTRSRAQRRDAKASWGWTIKRLAYGIEVDVPASAPRSFVQRVVPTKPKSARARHRESVALRRAYLM